MSRDAPALGDDTANRMARILGSASGIVPIAGPVIQAVISEVIPDIRINRIEVYIQYLQDRLDDLQLKAALNEPEGLDLFEEGLWQSARAFTEERKKYIGELVVSGLTNEDVEQNKVRHYLRILNQIGDEEIIVLASYQRKYSVLNSDAVKDFYNKHRSILGPFSRSMGSPDLPKAAHKDSLLAHLASFGLLVVTAEDLQTSRIKYGLTTQGKALLNYIGILEE